MQATIVGLSQELSLLDGDTTNSVVLELPNGVYVRALLSDEAAVEVTKAFVQSGVPAAAVAAQRASAAPEAPPMPAPASVAREAAVQAHPALNFGATAMTRQYSPVVLSDEPDDEGPDGQVFGGDYDDNASMAAIGQQLQHAEASLAHAVGDPGDMDRAGLQAAAARLRQGTPMPTPSWGGSPEPSPQPRRQLRVSKDDMGNPVLQGSGLVDTSLLVGGNNIEDGDVGQV
jgi:hypothetical protein